MILFIGIILTEFFEFSWQKGENMKDYIQNMFKFYQKGILYFSVLHVSFIYVLFCIFTLSQTSTYMYIIAIIKFFDISFKISILNRIERRASFEGFEDILNENVKLSNFSKLASSSFYIYLFYMGLNNTIV